MVKKKIKKYTLTLEFDNGLYEDFSTTNLNVHNMQIEDIRKAIRENQVLVLNQTNDTENNLRYEIPFPRKITAFISSEKEVEEKE